MRRNTPPRKQFGSDRFYLVLLCTPALLCMLVWKILPSLGIVLAFKNMRYDLGIWKSPWNGLDNFKYLFASKDLFQIVRNTIGYNLAFAVIETIAATAIAMVLFEFRNVRVARIFQTVSIVPNLISWVMVAYVVEFLFNPVNGILARLFELLQIGQVDIYKEVAAWPAILILFHAWKYTGLTSVIYYTTLIGIGSLVYEAASIDGAGPLRRALSISLPNLIPIASLMFLLQLGDLLKSDIGLFLQVPRGIGLLLPVADVIDTYVYRGITTGDFGTISAVSFVQSLFGVLLFAASSVAGRRKFRALLR